MIILHMFYFKCIYVLLSFLDSHVRPPFDRPAHARKDFGIVILYVLRLVLGLAGYRAIINLAVGSYLIRKFYIFACSEHCWYINGSVAILCQSRAMNRPQLKRTTHHESRACGPVG